MFFDTTAHLSEQDLLLAADREASPRRLARWRRHLSECAMCHRRLRELEHRLEEAVRLQQEAMPARRADDSRTRLEAELARLATEAPRSRVVWAAPGLAAGVIVAVAWFGMGAEPAAVFLHPQAALTPGLTRQVTLDELCGTARYGRARPVPEAVHQRVFASYGAPYERAEDYELDHLITPELGGASEPANLWPQPYEGTPWNAYVKDELEMHLHRLVCDGDMDLAVAQREMAADWIAAYKRHFQTDRPRRDYSTAPLTGADTAFVLAELDEMGLALHASHAGRLARRE
jgi:hypothetical protein